MIGTPHIDEQVVTPSELVTVIRDVRQQIGVLAIALDQDPILVVTELGGT